MIIIALPHFREKWGWGALVSPVAARDSRDQERRGEHVVRMAPVRNKTAEITEGRGGSVKKLSRPLRLNPVVLAIEWDRFNQDGF